MAKVENLEVEKMNGAHTWKKRNWPYLSHVPPQLPVHVENVKPIFSSNCCAYANYCYHQNQERNDSGGRHSLNIRSPSSRQVLKWASPKSGKTLASSQRTGPFFFRNARLSLPAKTALMRKYIAQIALFGCLALNLPAQTPDTTIYEVAEQMPLPLLARCQPERNPGWTEDSIRRCAEMQLLAIVAKNIRYPEEARQNNQEGTVVASFVVEKSGKISDVKILKDVGGGCGAEAMRVLVALDSAGLRWIPARREGKPVRMRQALPIKFRLQESLPYYLRETGDTIYVVTDSLPKFRDGDEGLMNFVVNTLRYPKDYQDSCKTGVIELALIIRANGATEIENQLDFSALGLDFQWEAIRLGNQMSGLWTPAVYQGRPVSTTVPLRTLFKSAKPGCQKANSDFDNAMLLAHEAGLLADPEPAKALEKWNQSVALQPDNTELLYYRATTLLALDRREEACKDFNRIKSLLGTTWFEQLRTIVCGR